MDYDKKKMIIENVRAETDYGLKETKDLMEAYSGGDDQDIYEYLDSAVIPSRTSNEKKIEENLSYLIKIPGDADYVAHSKEEAKRFCDWCESARITGFKVYQEVKL